MVSVNKSTLLCLLFIGQFVCNFIYPIENQVVRGFGSQMPALLTVMLHTQGAVLELGSGDFSTPLLHAICARFNRFLLTADQDLASMEKFLYLGTSGHVFVGVKPIGPKTVSDWMAIGNDRHWSVVFVDHVPVQRRVIDIERLRKNTDIFVVHDVNDEHVYGLDKCLASFKYQFVYKRYLPWTSVVSDVVDVAQFFKD